MNDHVLLDSFIRDLLANSRDLVFVKDADLFYRGASQAFAELAGRTDASQLLGKTDFDIFDDAELARRYRDDDLRLLAGGQPLIGYVEPIPSPDGRPRYSSTSKFIIHDDQGRVIGLYGIGYDVTREYEAKLNYERELRYLFELPQDALAAAIFDITSWRVMDMRIRESSVKVVSQYGRIEEFLSNAAAAAEEEEARSFLRGLDRDKVYAMYESGKRRHDLEYLRHDKEGGLRWVRNEFHFLTDPSNGHLNVLVVFRDVDELKRAETELTRAAETDAMTGLLNREATMKHITGFLRQEGADGQHALFMVDIDDFKQINDTFGHQTGDEVIIEIAAAIKSVFRDSDIVGRIGGDEFFALMKNFSTDRSIEKKAAQMIGVLQYVCSRGDGPSVALSGSVGVSVYLADNKPLSQLYAEADEAMYRAKAQGKNRFACAFWPESGLDASAPFDREAASAVHLRTLLENMDAFMLLAEVEEDIRIVYSSQSLTPTKGRPEDAVENMDDIWDLVVPADLPALRQAIFTAAHENKPLDHVFRIRHEGEILWRQMRGSLLPDSGDGIRRMLIVTTDISALKRSEEELSFAELRYRTAMEQSDIVMWEVDIRQRQLMHHGEFVRKTDREMRIFEDAPESFIAEGWVDPGSVEKFRSMFDDIYAGRESGEYILKIYDPAGQRSWVKRRYTLLRDTDGQPYYTIGISVPLPDEES